MPKNVEIKASLSDFGKTFAIAQKLCNGQEPKIMKQCDTFFKSPNGRLKLREFIGTDSPAELIFYDRPDSEGPKVSTFVKTETTDPSNLKSALEKSMEIKGILSKTRYLFMYGQTRIHLDHVEGLGDNMELEVCLNDNQAVEEGNAIAEELMKKLEIPNTALIQGAYIDKLLAKTA
uniref:CYTH domain-containing protein n=1 Tax=Panagrolaimus davidi TaxID=227884 RepID=A0A914R170_9BILA